jgi:hypothetical protein
MILLSNLLDAPLVTGKMILQLTVILRDHSFISQLVFAGFIAPAYTAPLSTGSEI